MNLALVFYCFPYFFFFFWFLFFKGIEKVYTCLTRSSGSCFSFFLNNPKKKPTHTHQKARVGWCGGLESNPSPQPPERFLKKLKPIILCLVRVDFVRLSFQNSFVFLVLKGMGGTCILIMRWGWCREDDFLKFQFLSSILL